MKKSSGLIAGNVMDSVSQKAIAGASVQLALIGSDKRFTKATDKNGVFSFDDLSPGYYSLSISFIDYAMLRIDSIHVRAERSDFNLADIRISARATELETVVDAEKPLIESKEGNITFNASESAIAAGSNASELLNVVPLVSKDPSGKILVRRKEPKILIDDKPVEFESSAATGSIGIITRKLY
jgi:hypothetical protein